MVENHHNAVLNASGLLENAKGKNNLEEEGGSPNVHWTATYHWVKSNVERMVGEDIVGWGDGGDSWDNSLTIHTLYKGGNATILTISYMG